MLFMGRKGFWNLGKLSHLYMSTWNIYIYMFTTRLCIVRGGGDNLQFYGSFSFSDVVF